MTVYRPPDRRTYRYDFEFHGRRYLGTTGHRTKKEASAYEARFKEQLRARAAGRFDLPLAPGESPHFSDWAEEYFKYAEKHVDKPERIADLIRVVMRFWGRKPDPKSGLRIVEGEPYHDLRLADPIMVPEWILRFEAWMEQRGRSAQTRNHYRSVMSRMYRVALLPQFRATTGVTMNPFAGIPREPTYERTVTVTVPELRAWLSHAAPHVRLALAIAALAPQLRLQDILGLRWDIDLDPALTYLTIRKHKTVRKTRRAQVLPISAQLRALLEHIRKTETSPYVVTYRGEPMTVGIRDGVEAAAIAAQLKYGRDVEGGVTFHTLRHSMATILAELEVPEAQRKDVMGHSDLATTQKYTHLRPAHLKKSVEQLSAAVPLLDLFGLGPRKPAKTPKSTGGKTAGPARRKVAQTTKNRGLLKKASNRSFRQ